jgi:O-methyltransferase involved in polyketide biosynthesis
MEKEKTFKGVMETLLLPLWGRAVETRKDNPILIDHTAVKIVETLHYDFSQIATKMNPVSIASWACRSIYFDMKIREFLNQYPEGSVISVGCGFDTTYDRVNNGSAHWYELDFPDVIEQRKKYISETPNRHFLSYSVFDEKWHKQIANKDQVMIMIAGVIYYFTEEQVRGLFRNFSRIFANTHIIMDYASPLGVRISNKMVIEKGGMDENSYLKWGTNNLHTLTEYIPGLKVIEDVKMYYRYRNHFPFKTRIGMFLSDLFGIMSLGHITITQESDISQ